MRRRHSSIATAALSTISILAGLWALGWAWWAEHQAGMVPCALCLWERWPYRLLILLGLLGIAAATGGRNVVGLLRGAMTAVLVAAIVIAGVHVGVEQGWWQSPLPECAAPHFVAGTLSERLAAMPLRPAKPCDSPQRLLSWLPVSMATLDLLYAALLLAGCWLIRPETFISRTAGRRLA